VQSEEHSVSNPARDKGLSFLYEFLWRVIMPIRIVLADDHVLVRQGLKSLLEREKFQVLAEASDGQEAVRLTETHQPDIAVLDISMPTLNGIDAARELGRSCPKTKTILLTQHEEEQYIHEALEAGVNGYVLKNQVASDLVHAIHQVSRGDFYLSPGISRAVMEAYRSKRERPADPLTVRERQVLQLIAEGKSTKDTASLLGISTKTAESHRMRLMQKLDIHETASLVRYAVRRGLVEP
jgi:two-component system, NarL family, response regulator NreC